MTSGEKMSIIYMTTLENITVQALEGGFFAGWSNPPDAGTHLRILRGSDHSVLAVDDETGKVIGFITAISDGVTAAFIPHLEVLAPYKKQGVGSELTQRLGTVGAQHAAPRSQSKPVVQCLVSNNHPCPHPRRVTNPPVRQEPCERKCPQRRDTPTRPATK